MIEITDKDNAQIFFGKKYENLFFSLIPVVNEYIGSLKIDLIIRLAHETNKKKFCLFYFPWGEGRRIQKFSANENTIYCEKGEQTYQLNFHQITLIWHGYFVTNLTFITWFL